jgi:hypothetical protein
MLSDFNADPKLHAIAEQTKEQVRGAVDTYFDLLKKTISSYPSGGTEFGEKLKSYSEKNIASTHQFIKQLTQAKDFQDMMRIQTEFMQTQLSTFGEQTESLGRAYTNAATAAINTPFKNAAS